jgi:hypothetical protein
MSSVSSESVHESVQSAASSPEALAQLHSQLETGSEKIQLQAIADLATQAPQGLKILQDFLLTPQGSTWVRGRAYEVLLAADDTASPEFLQTHFPQGIVPLKSLRGIDYKSLQRSLAQHDFQVADQITLEKLCELSGAAASRRKWVYFTEIDGFPIEDLQTIDQLWLAHSEGKFGFSVQRKLWLGVDKNWEALWPKIGWREGKKWTRYPQEFIWDLTAPRGHLPLSNQLRGVQVINALLNHPAWST